MNIFDFEYGYGTSYGMNGVQVWLLISLVVAIIGGVLGYLLFVKQNKKIDNKYLSWFRQFLDYRKMLIEDLLKVLYMITAIYITLSSFAYIGSDFLMFILTLVLGNLICRLAFEGCLVIIMIWKNTDQINRNLKK